MKIVRTLIALALVVAAGTWAYYTNVASGKPAMDMSARVTGAASAFPVTLATVEQGAVRGTVVYTGSVAAYNGRRRLPPRDGPHPGAVRVPRGRGQGRAGGRAAG